MPAKELSKHLDVSIKRDRSPSYPRFALPEAIDKLNSIYSRVKNQSVTRDTVEGVLGFKKAVTSEIIATLKHYGLLEAPRGGGVKISPLGLEIVISVGEKKSAAIRKAAQTPELFKKYREKWGHDIPSNEVCLSHLRLEDGFTESGAQQFLSAFSQTMRDFHGEAIEMIKPPLPSSLPTSPEKMAKPEAESLACLIDEKKLEPTSHHVAEPFTKSRGESLKNTADLSRILDQIRILKEFLRELSPGNRELVVEFLKN